MPALLLKLASSASKSGLEVTLQTLSPLLIIFQMQVLCRQIWGNWCSLSQAALNEITHQKFSSSTSQLALQPNVGFSHRQLFYLFLLFYSTSVLRVCHENPYAGLSRCSLCYTELLGFCSASCLMAVSNLAQGQSSLQCLTANCTFNFIKQQQISFFNLMYFEAR